MKKTALGAILCLCLALLLLPGLTLTAAAAEGQEEPAGPPLSPRSITYYDLWVAGVRVTSENAADIFEDGTAYFIADTETLVLDNATLTVTSSQLPFQSESPYDGSKYFETAAIYRMGNLKIDLIGENTIDMSGSADTYAYSSGIALYQNLYGGKLRIRDYSGDATKGSLDIQVGSGTSNTTAVFVDGSAGNISVENCILTATGETSGSKNALLSGWGSNIKLINADVKLSGVYPFGYYPLSPVLEYTTGYQWRTSPAGDFQQGGDVPFRNDSSHTYLEIRSVDQYYDLWVGGVHVNNLNAGDILRDGGSAIFDPDLNTLSLNEAHITGGVKTQAGPTQSSVFAAIFSKFDLFIDLTGENSIDISDAPAYQDVNFAMCISTFGQLNIKGPGSLDLTNAARGQYPYAYAIGTAQAVTFENCTVTHTAGDAAGVLYMGMSPQASPNVTFKNASFRFSTTHPFGRYTADNVNSLYFQYTNGYEWRTAPEDDFQLGTVEGYTCEKTHTYVEIRPKTDDFLWVAGVRVTAGNANDVLGDRTVSYNAGTKTLTLRNADIRRYCNDYAEGSFTASSAILGFCDLNIELLGKNRIDVSGVAGGSHSRCIDLKGALNITGSGSLTAISGSGSWATAISANSIRMEECAVTASATAGVVSNHAFSTAPDLVYPEGYQWRAGSESAFDQSTNTVYGYSGQGYTEIRSAVYDLWVGGVRATAYNAEDILKDGKVSYDLATNTLILNGADISQCHDYSVGSFPARSAILCQNDLNIRLLGKNNIDLTGISADNFLYCINVDGSLNIEGPGSLLAANGQGLWGASISAPSITLKGCFVTVVPGGSTGNGTFSQAPNLEYPEGYRWRTSAQGGFTLDADTPYSYTYDQTYTEIFPLIHYDLWVAGVQVNSFVAGDILGDGTASYDMDSGTLILNGAHITAYSEYDSPAAAQAAVLCQGDLKLKLAGTNSMDLSNAGPAYYTNCIDVSGDLHISGDGSLALTPRFGYWATAVSAGSVTLQDCSLSASVSGGDSVRIFSTAPSLAYGFEYKWRSSATDSYTRGSVSAYPYDGSLSYTQLYAEIVPLDIYDLWVGGVRVNEVNCLDVLGDGKVSYDADARLLTLNGAGIDEVFMRYSLGYEGSFPIYSAIFCKHDLNIALAGENSIDISNKKGTYGYCIEVSGDLQITGPGSLRAVNSRSNWPTVISGRTTLKDCAITLISTQGISYNRIFSEAPILDYANGYRWRISAADGFTKSSDAAYAVDSSLIFSQTYAEIRPPAGSGNNSGGDSGGSASGGGNSGGSFTETDPPLAGDAGAPSVPDKDCSFTDVSETDWFFPDVMFVVQKGYMLGTGEGVFDPYGSTTRAMVATILWRMEGEPAPAGSSSFSDVESGQWYSRAIAWAEEQGLIEGYGDGSFGPNDPVTRQQLATLLYRYARYKGYDVMASGDLDPFADRDEVSPWAEESLKWAVGAELMQGKPGDVLDPGDTATRAEFAALLHRFLEKAELM